MKESKNGVIVCPTLLATVCRYCKQNGHTVKYCSSVKNKPPSSEARVVVTTHKDELVVKKVNLQVNTRINRYGALSDDSDDEVTTLLPVPVLQRQPAVVVPKRWVDYDSDSDIEQEI